MIERIMTTRTTADWIAVLDAEGVPCAPVQNVREMVEHPQTQALGLLQPMPRGTMQLLGLPVSFDGEHPEARLAPPAIGEHTTLVFRGPEE
jgi:crotonobetainyl-CoA:carnitine CoA-transferase CaiB-like acyl-CoA transferase